MRLFLMLLLWAPAALWAAGSPGYDFVEVDFSENNPDFKPYSNGDGYNFVGAISLPERNFAFVLYNDAPFRASGNEIGRGQEIDYWAIAGLGHAIRLAERVDLIVDASFRSTSLGERDEAGYGIGAGVRLAPWRPLELTLHLAGIDLVETDLEMMAELAIRPWPALAFVTRLRDYGQWDFTAYEAGVRWYLR